MSKGKGNTKDTMCRKYHICLNNGIAKGFTQERIIEILSAFPSLRYACGGLEVGEQQTEHWHIYCLFKNGVRHSTMRRAFEGQANVQNAKGSSLENRAYILKEGKHISKASTRVPDTFFEIGDFPDDEKTQGYRTDLSLLVDMVRDDASISSIIETSPSYIRYIGHIEKLKAALDKENSSKIIRELKVVFVFGGRSKSRLEYIYNTYGIDNVFRCVNYQKNCFDGFDNEPVICFDNFKDSFPIQDMISLYLSPMPLQLSCRYNNKNATYTTAIISSRHQPEELYFHESSEDRQEFLDSLDTIIQLCDNGTANTFTNEQYFDIERGLENTDNPFQNK